MSQTILHNLDSQVFNFAQHRLAHLTLFFQIKEKVKCLTRQTLFLGIAICDKIFENTEAMGSCGQDLEREGELRAITCIWIAWKFIETDKIPIKKLLEKIQGGITSCQVLQMEAIILQKIDFQIPSATPYATMINEFNSFSDRRNGAVIAGQCIKFLMEALKFSKDFSLCVELGPKILQLYRERSLNDSRIRSVYLQIQQKSEGKMMNAIKAH